MGEAGTKGSGTRFSLIWDQFLDRMLAVEISFASGLFPSNATSFGSNFRRLGLLRLGLRVGSVAENIFYESRVVFMISESSFKCFPEASGAVFLLSAAPETGLKMDG